MLETWQQSVEKDWELVRELANVREVRDVTLLTTNQRKTVC